MNNNIEEFNKIWEEIVFPLINNVSEVLHLRCKNYKLVRFVMRHVFLKETKVFINSYMVSKTKNIDRHKLAACMVKAILFAKPLRLSFSDKIAIIKLKRGSLSNDLFLTKKVFSNQFLALSVAITILDGYIQADQHKILHHKIILPDPFPSEDDFYQIDVCMDMFFSGVSNFNVMTYANVFFLLEKYSCRRVQCDNLEIAYKKLLKGNPPSLGKEQSVEEFIDSIKFNQKPQEDN